MNSTYLIYIKAEYLQNSIFRISLDINNKLADKSW